MVINCMISTLIILLGNYYIEGCMDQSLSCKQWSASGYCNSYKQYMSKNCRLSCKMCQGCTDTDGYCSLFAPYCSDPDYKDFLIRTCKKTCNFCSLQPGCGKKAPSHQRIVGGTNAKPGDWPWQVNINYIFNSGKSRPICGGTLIDEEWVLSAAHCFYGYENKEKYNLKLGEHNMKRKSNLEQTYNITELILHPKYNDDNLDHDLALLRLNRKASFNKRVGTACLPGQNTNFPIATKCFITGWGLLKENGSESAILQQAKVSLVTRKTCQTAFDHLGIKITSDTLCAGDSSGKIGTCEGDSGGPLVCKIYDNTIGEEIWYLRGTTSWGLGCATKGFYEVFASPIVMRPWIDSIVFKGKV